MSKSWKLYTWFASLPILAKQILVLVTSEVLVVGLLTFSAYWIIKTSLTAQIQAQAKSELQVLEVSYNIKVNQMGFGFRGQSDNTAIIEAAARGQSNPVVREILVKETKARIIEYATLVGVDRQIIENAHQPRYGETFDPNGLVTKVLKQGQQIKTTDFLPIEELAKEHPEAANVVRKSLPTNTDLEKQGALVRYTLTPVRQSQKIIGVLVSGDIINDALDVFTANSKDPGKKSAVVDRTLETLNGGFSAIALYNVPVSVGLVTGQGIERKELPDPESLSTLLQGNTTQIVRGTLAGKGYTFVSEPLRNNQIYTSKSLRNTRGAIIGHLIRGTPDTALALLLQRSLTAELGIGIGVLLLDVLIGIFLARQISHPIRRITTLAKEASVGKLDGEIEPKFHGEMGELVQAFNQMKRSLVNMQMQQAVHYNWGLDRYEKHDLGGAIHHFRSALALDPEYVEVHTALARALADQGDSVGAVEHYRTALRLRPENPSIHFKLGVALYNQGEHKLGFEELKSALHLYKQRGLNAEALDVENFLGRSKLTSL